MQLLGIAPWATPRGSLFGDKVAYKPDFVGGYTPPPPQKKKKKQPKTSFGQTESVMVRERETGVAGCRSHVPSTSRVREVRYDDGSGFKAVPPSQAHLYLRADPGRLQI